MNLTQREQDILSILEDGDHHSVSELRDRVIGRRYVSHSLIPTHVGRLKRKLQSHTIYHKPKHGYQLMEKSHDD